MRLAAFALLTLVAASCGGDRPAAQSTRLPAMLVAFVAADKLPVHKELSMHSDVIAQAKFGDKVEVLRRRRVMMLVRLPDETSGWVDGRLLIRPREMEALAHQAKEYKDTPSMGTAKAYDSLNIHTSPSRGSPSLAQIKDEQTVEVLGHRVALRAPYQPTVTGEDFKKKKKKGKGDLPELDDPPPPKAPALPSDWEAISRGQTEPVEEVAERKKTRRQVKNALLLKAEQDRKKAQTGPTYDDWSLVRTHAGQVGWALSSALVMALPDEILQYAQRQRVTSYFKLGEVNDPEKGRKGVWFWTTSSKRGQAYQFDAMRLFVFSAKRHRYESALNVKDQVGYFPVEVTGVSEGKPVVAVILEDGGGQTTRRRFSYENGRLRLLDQVKVPKPRQPQALEELPVMSIPEPAEDEEQTWWGRTLKNLFGK